MKLESYILDDNDQSASLLASMVFDALRPSITIDQIATHFFTLTPILDYPIDSAIKRDQRPKMSITVVKKKNAFHSDQYNKSTVELCMTPLVDFNNC